MKAFPALDRYLEDLVKTGPSACGCMVTWHGEPIYERYFGVRDMITGIPADERTIFRQASTTKLSIMTALLILFERGQVLLDDPVGYYLPEWMETKVAVHAPNGQITIKAANRPITLRDCMTMAVGIGSGGLDYTGCIGQNIRNGLAEKTPKYTLQDDLKAMSVVPACFEPGSHFMYRFGHDLVAGVIEAVSGMTIGEFLCEEIFKPLGMKDTAYRFSGDQKERTVTLYRLLSDGIREKIPELQYDARHQPDAVYEAGVSGLFSTVRDYSALMTMLANGGQFRGIRILGRKTIDLMRRNQLDGQRLSDFSDPRHEGCGYGLGVRTMMNPTGSNDSAGDFGWYGMFGTYVSADPSEELAIVYMHNCLPALEREAHLRIRHLVYSGLQ